MLCMTLNALSRLTKSLLAYWLPWSEWKIILDCAYVIERCHHQFAASASPIPRLAKSITTARYIHPSPVGTNVMSPTHLVSLR
jgi:hypothetical protein